METTEEQTPDTQTKENNTQSNTTIFMIPGAIILAGVLIAGAIILSNNPLAGGQAAGAAVGTGDSFGNNLSAAAENIRPVDDTDHIRGNPDAPITIVEFSDFECPFCARFHPTLKRVLKEYPQVKWVYRHFPLTSIHGRALGAAVASECAAALGGTDTFWQFTDALIENQHNLGTELYTTLAEDLGISLSQFSLCLDSKEPADAVQADLEDAINSGGRGTPYSVVINEDGELFPFSGALQYEQVQLIIESAIES